MRRTIGTVSLTLGFLLSVVAFRAATVKGQANPLGLNVDNFAGISSDRYPLSLSVSKAGEPVGSIPPHSGVVVAFNRSQPHPIDPAGGHFEFHGDFAVYPQLPSYMAQRRYHPDKTAFQWASEAPVALIGHDMDLVISRVQ